MCGWMDDGQKMDVWMGGMVGDGWMRGGWMDGWKAVGAPTTGRITFR